MSRALSWSEISMALTCEARHAFAYTGHLTGGVALKRRATALPLSNGRAWGAAVAAWHAFSGHETLESAFDPALARLDALRALRDSYDADADEQADRGVWLEPGALAERELWLGEILEHYMSTAVRLDNLTRIEEELDEPIPSRTGVRSSSRYHFVGFIDGFTVDQPGNEWVAEFKLRTKLTPVHLVQLSRQIRWYAWARQRQTGKRVVGVIVDERLAAAPKPARLVQAGRPDILRPSHAVDQMTTPQAYIDLCTEYGVEPHDDTVAALSNREWQKRIPIMFEPGELEEAGRELVSAAKLIRDLDSGERYPVRNAIPYICNGCAFREICADPSDRLYLETLYELTEPKRLRPELMEAA